MPQQNASLKVSNLTTIGAAPLPPLIAPPLPERLRKLDPEGCDEFINEFNRRIQTWLTGSNTQFQAQVQSLSTLIKKP